MSSGGKLGAWRSVHHHGLWGHWRLEQQRERSREPAGSSERIWVVGDEPLVSSRNRFTIGIRIEAAEEEFGTEPYYLQANKVDLIISTYVCRAVDGIKLYEWVGEIG